MIPAHYVWLAWAGAFFLSWLALYAVRPDLRRTMWAGSLLALPFGFSEPLFLGRYWSPPTLFNLARVAHFDLETFLFCFAIGGVAAVLFNAVTGRPLRWRAKTEQD